MKTILAIVLAATLAGCGSSYKYTVADDKAPLDPAVAEPCDLVPDAPARGLTMGQLYDFSNSMVGLYGECAIRDMGKYRWIKSQGH